jgi:hypothetical protein
MNEALTNSLKFLAQRAADHPTADEAMKFTQAACNLANALMILHRIEVETKPPRK